MMVNDRVVARCASFLAIILFAAFLYGCESTESYKVLSFFFDGVPNPEEIKAAQMKKQAAEELKRSGLSGPKTSYKHGPYAARMCDSCHKTEQSNLMSSSLKDICSKCHQFGTNKKYVHGPFAVGDCLMCHDPHDSKYEFLLIAAPEKLCFNCHDEKAITESDLHSGTDMKCISCHDPHMSDEEYMLK